MARILLFITNTMPDPGPNMSMSGQATIEGATEFVGWIAEVPWGSTPVQINDACEAAAVAAAEAAGHVISVGANSRITLAPAKSV